MTSPPRPRVWLPLLAAASCLLAAGQPVADDGSAPVEIGTRRELFVDNFLLASRSGVDLRLHAPIPREVAIVHDAPWEGSGCGYHTVFRDGDRFRMYYIAAKLTNEDATQFPRPPQSRTSACYAESRDGIHWTKPELGLVEFQGSTRNNIVWRGEQADNFTVFRDPNPACRPGEEYKAVASGKGGLYALKSADGLRWSTLSERPIITQGKFDTQNIAFWDPVRKHYWAYIRDFHDGIRDIRVATSTDFRSWTPPEMLRYVDSPDEALYTNQVIPYYRAPHLFVGFPTRYVERPWSSGFKALPDPEHRMRRMKLSPRFGTAITDGMFMTSRDGRTFRRWNEAFVRPGIERKNNWLYGDGYQNWGLIETAPEDPLAPPEISIFVDENSWKTAVRARRYTLRIDGFVSLGAPAARGEARTKPLVFGGRTLELNFSTSAAGSIRVELQDAAGTPIPGHALADCDEIFGDALERPVTWKDDPDLHELAGRPIRLRIVMQDADLYSLRFRE
jgi:hypothetical protein